MKTALIFVPCYKRPEYTKKCLDAILTAQDYCEVSEHRKRHYPNNVIRFSFYLIDDGSDDETFGVIKEFNDAMMDICPDIQIITEKHDQTLGLRSSIIEVFRFAKTCGMLGERHFFDFITKVDNDCAVPKNWLNDIIATFERHPELGIVSPNVFPSNAAFTYGRAVEGKTYREADIVGGVWTMRTELINDVMFENYPAGGITGAISVLRQIRIEKDPVIGWLPDVVFQDIGHHSGAHPEHIKSVEHFVYSQQVGRPVSWTPQIKSA